ncbi:MAG TPA: hypothetical protein VLH08_02855 [Acidobacteriota bacterium]|nr:hypothetical protein [Acidobacteriota bacterium]
MTFKFGSVLVLGVFMFFARLAFASDEMYYSAAICTPTWQHAFNGSGEQGFEWIIPYGGFWLNFDVDDYETLVCPIPYDRSAGGPFEVRVVVGDWHNTKAIVAEVHLSDNNGVPYLAGSASSGNNWTGVKTLTISVEPNDEDRWVNLYVKVPDEKNGSMSYVKGYRVCRDCD